MFRKNISLPATILTLLLFPHIALGQLSDSRSWAATAADQYEVIPNITYVTANNWDAKLDLYLPANSKEQTPTLIWFHGGGWTIHSKEMEMLYILPYLEMGWAVVNVEYRLARVSLAPAAVEDCRCALRWVITNAQKYKFDTSKLILSGISAGGHLALTTGMLPKSAGLDNQCSGSEELKVAAIINWFGPSDVADLIDGPHAFDQAISWLGSQPNRVEIAKRVSPIAYARPGLPPIITIHGDQDSVIPYNQSVRLHQALDKVGVPNQLITIKGRGHGEFNREETLRAYTSIREFLIKNGL
ncbi:MAG: alpha/beta hydrolase fold domain-containing protein [Pyrinomonadaceae bacterium]